MHLKHRRSLRVQIIFSFLIITLFSSVAMGVYSYRSARVTIETTVGETALSIIKSVVNQVDTERFATLREAADMELPYYSELSERLNSIRESLGLKYLYTMRQNEHGQYVYVVDGLPWEERSLLNDEEDIDNMSDKWIAGVQGTPGYEIDAVSDESGSLISAYYPIRDEAGNVIGMLGADFDGNLMSEQLVAVRGAMIASTLVVTLLGALAGAVLAILLVRSLKDLQVQAGQLQHGDLTVKFRHAGRRDEVGSLAGAFQTVVDSLANITRSIRESTRQVLQHAADLTKGAQSTHRTAAVITEIVGQVASGSEQQVESVEGVSSSMQEVFRQIQRVTEHAGKVTQAADTAVAEADAALRRYQSSMQQVNRISDSIGHTATIVESLGQKSEEIGSFSQTISGIASQTNLLALNAAIEAARAGENGRGFAVVADQVKTLASEVNKASSQINGLVNIMQGEIRQVTSAIEDGVRQAHEGVRSSAELDGYLGNLLSSNDNVKQLVHEVLEAVGIIEQSCQQALSRLMDLATISKQFSAGAQQAAASTEEQMTIIQATEQYLTNLREIAAKLEQTVNLFKLT